GAPQPEPAVPDRRRRLAAGPDRRGQAARVRTRVVRRPGRLAAGRPPRGRRPARGLLHGGQPMKPAVAEVTARIVERSRDSRRGYLQRMDAAASSGPGRGKLSCANWAHAFAGQPAADKLRARGGVDPNIGIVTAYNDMLSAHKTFEHFPEL